MQSSRFPADPGRTPSLRLHVAMAVCEFETLVPLSRGGQKPQANGERVHSQRLAIGESSSAARKSGTAVRLPFASQRSLTKFSDEDGEFQVPFARLSSRNGCARCPPKDCVEAAVSQKKYRSCWSEATWRARCFRNKRRPSSSAGMARASFRNTSYHQNRS